MINIAFRCKRAAQHRKNNNGNDMWTILAEIASWILKQINPCINQFVAVCKPVKTMNTCMKSSGGQRWMSIEIKHSRKKNSEWKLKIKQEAFSDINYYIAEKLTKWTCHNENGG